MPVPIICLDAQVRQFIELMEATIRTFEPVVGTVTHVMLDTWYSAKCLWRAARQRGFLIPTGLKSNRWLWIADPSTPKAGAGRSLPAIPRKIAPMSNVVP